MCTSLILEVHPAAEFDPAHHPRQPHRAWGETCVIFCLTLPKGVQEDITTPNFVFLPFNILLLESLVEMDSEK